METLEILSRANLPSRAGLKEFLADKGHVLLRQFLPPDSVESVGQDVQHALAQQGYVVTPDGPPTWTGMDVNKVDDVRLYSELTSLDSLFYSDAFRSVYRLVFEDEGMPWARQVLRYARPRDDGHAAPPHQDSAQNGPNMDWCTFWVPLMPIDENVGGLAVARDSHLSGERPHRPHETARSVETRNRVSLTVEEDPAGYRWATAEFSPGDILVMHPNTVHRAQPNQSDLVRLSTDRRVQPRSTPVAPWNALDRQGLKNVRTMVSEVAAHLGHDSEFADMVLFEVQKRGIELTPDAVADLVTSLPHVAQGIVP